MILTLTIKEKAITTEQLNSLVSFCSRFINENGNDSLEIFCEKYPLLLKGKLSELTNEAKRYFYEWNKDNSIRNIRLVN